MQVLSLGRAITPDKAGRVIRSAVTGLDGKRLRIFSKPFANIDIFSPGSEVSLGSPCGRGTRSSSPAFYCVLSSIVSVRRVGRG